MAKYVKNREALFMKGKKITTVSIMLAAAAVSAVLGGALLQNSVKAEESTVNTYALDSIFNVSTDASIQTTVKGEGDSAKKVATFKLADSTLVTLKRNLALKWMKSETQTGYLTVSFAFADTNFKKITLSLDSVSAWATEGDKTTNTVTFENDGTNVTAYVNEKTADSKVITLGDKTAKLTLTLGEAATSKDGEFTVSLAEEGGATHTLDSFVNIGANYAKYTSANYKPLSFKAEFDANATQKTTDLLLYDINGQKFDDVTDDKKVEDTAAPVLVVNQELDGFLMGTKFDLSADDDDYKVIDVVQSGNLTPTIRYYQYSPVAEAIEAGKEKEAYSSLSTSTIFLPTSYEKEISATEKEWTTVYAEQGKEYVSIYFEMGDDTFKQTTGTTNLKNTVFLSWYSSSSKGVDCENNLDPLGNAWMYLNRNEYGATYNYISFVDDGTGVMINKLPDINSADADEVRKAQDYQAAKGYFEDQLAAAAAKVYAGSNAEIQIPSLKWLLSDNNGYRSLKFTISYLTPNSSAGSPTSPSGLDFNELEIPTAAEGWYKFKVFANDAAGNKMQCYLDGELVDVTADNVWDIDEIPVFSFYVEDKGLKVEESATATSSSRRDTKVKDSTYTLSSSNMKVVGATDLKKDYALYKVNFQAYNNTVEAAKQITKDDLLLVKYSDLATQLAGADLTGVTDYLSKYLELLAKAIGERKGLSATEQKSFVENCFVKIGKAGDTVNNASDEFESYEWDPTAPSFTTATTGEYLLLADFWEKANPVSRATAYRLIVVESEKDTISGEDEWLKNNIVSVVLFAIAGVMLILIIILLFIKPSDETLEDVEENEKKKAKKASKKKDETPTDENK